MKSFDSLNELIACDERSRALFESIPPQQQVSLQEQQQCIRTYADLENAVHGIQKQSGSWQAK